ncbi:unnamed protein product [Arabis nemorensis]|uniref:RBR-type E3 ubiquitin transferase n=1 Tax=Arabis nemorensis TaxID=586526 RepID=A0A565C1K5_9BRAS|nr:unnamed protein product [Arabis nemorensis]
MDYSDDDMLEDNYHYSDDDDVRDSEYMDEEDSTSNRAQIGYVVLKEEDIHKHQRDDIERVSTILSISQAEAIVLLLHTHWSVSKVEDEWFTNEDRVRSLVGILKEHVFEYNHCREVNVACGICFESYAQNEILTVSCGHPYCITCWTGYIAAKIDDGPGCLMVKCPEPSCSAAIGQDLIDKVTNEKDKDKYYSFCWNCTEDAHRPVDCETVSKWIFKNNDESENTTWILGNTKPCPKCKRYIEKNMGCMHMTCSSPCKHEFCWLCLSDWQTTTQHNCNKFDEDDENETKRKMAKNASERYMHYYERWASNQSSRLKAMEDLEKLQSVQLKELSYKQGTPETQLQFTVEAWLQIIECRRVLKWTFAYGYYLPNHEQAKKQFFEYLQGEAEAGLERLHHCAESELNHFVSNTEGSPKNFSDFRNKLIGLTKVTKTYFENLVKALENGLADVSKSPTNSESFLEKDNKIVR